MVRSANTTGRRTRRTAGAGSSKVCFSFADGNAQAYLWSTYVLPRWYFPRTCVVNTTTTTMRRPAKVDNNTRSRKHSSIQTSESPPPVVSVLKNQDKAWYHHRNTKKEQKETVLTRVHARKTSMCSSRRKRIRNLVLTREGRTVRLLACLLASLHAARLFPDDKNVLQQQGSP